jgi:hypothetical protein
VAAHAADLLRNPMPAERKKPKLRSLGGAQRLHIIMY